MFPGSPKNSTLNLRQEVYRKCVQKDSEQSWSSSAPPTILMEVHRISTRTNQMFEGKA